MKDDNRDAHDIKKFAEVLGESQMMIPDSVARRDKSIEDLRECVSVLRREEGGDAELMGCEWMVEAVKITGEDGGGSGRGSGNGNSAGNGEDVAVTSVDGLADGEAF